LLRYYKAAYFVTEDLGFKIDEKNANSTEANRKTKNIWYRRLSSHLINKHCTTNGIQNITINPCYSSFIGNLMYNYTDAINASIEICRRGIFKYAKGKFYPQMTGTMGHTMSKRNPQVDYLRDVDFFKDCHSWVESYKKVRDLSGLRYRATLDDVKTPFSLVGNLKHVLTTKIDFIKKNQFLLLNS
jgi:hypothetical protein